jgi:hypothetical protein
MGMEGGTYLWTYPDAHADTEAALGIDLSAAGVGKGYISVVDGCDMVEFGITLTVASTGGQLYAALYQAPAPGGTYLPLYTLRAKSAAAIAGGVSLKRYTSMKLTKGTVLRFDITTPAAGASGIFYVKAYPNTAATAQDMLSI